MADRISLSASKRVRSAPFGIILSLLVLGSAPFSAYLWTFIPLGLAFFLGLKWQAGVVLGAASLFFTLFLNRIELSDLDFIGLGMLFIGGIFLFRFSQRAKVFYRSLLSFGLIGTTLVVAFFVFQRFHLSSEGFDAWLARESQGNLLPIVFAEQYWPQELDEIYKIVWPLYKATFMGWFLVSLILSYLFSGLLLRLYQAPVSNRRFLVEFSLWRAPDWILIPLVFSLGALAFQAPNLIPHEFSWYSWGVWNLMLLSLLPLMFSGISLLAWLLPRLSYMLLFVVFFLLVVYTLPVLTLTGLADIWFDLRRRLRASAASGDLED